MLMVCIIGEADPAKGENVGPSFKGDSVFFSVEKVVGVREACKPSDWDAIPGDMDTEELAGDVCVAVASPSETLVLGDTVISNESEALPGDIEPGKKKV